MKIIAGFIGTAFLLMGLFSLVVVFILLRLQYLNEVGIAENPIDSLEVNAYVVLALVTLAIGSGIMWRVKRIGW